MCGIVGVMSKYSFNAEKMLDVVRGMSSAIKHRGPDDCGTWLSNSENIIFAHQRLSVIDLSDTGHQPMLSSSKRYAITFNGEIYNHRILRAELSKKYNISWQGTSDTETLLATIEQYGIKRALKKIVGMFAFSLWDEHNRELFLVRDRFGEKPLYYGWVGDNFIFASELKALKKFPEFSNDINRDALNQFLRLNYVPSPYSIYTDIYKLEPGSLMCIRIESFPEKFKEAPLDLPIKQKNFEISKWWSLDAVVESGVNNQILDIHQANHEIERQLKESVKLQSLSDVPLGSFLSGGIDSSLVSALMQEQSIKPINTFTIGFEDKKYDESVYASAVAKHLGTNHTEVFITSNEARGIIPLLPDMYDEPFADSSQIPTYLVSSIARKQVTVALSGDGADELFGGYNRYTQGPKIWGNLFKIPRSLRQVLGSSIRSIPIAGWDRAGRSLNYLKFGSQNFSQLGNKAHKIATRLKEMDTIDDIYLNPVSEWPRQVDIVKGLSNSGNQLNDRFVEAMKLLSDPECKMMFLDGKTYLSDDILCKVDRASMSVSLETRAPFLDHRLAELAWRLPLNMKINNGKGKYILRQLLYKYVPKKLIERPKMGFGIPLGQWLRGPLREWAEELLNEKRLEKEGYLNPQPVAEVWKKHLSGKYDYSTRLWAILMFQAWLETSRS
jgi:asparagine synthase (glutamine-hydrolysing)